MKKSILLFVMLAAYTLPGISQKLYFKGQIGYDIGFLKSQLKLVSDNIIEYADSSTDNSTYESHMYSYATGISFTAGLGIMITKNISAELTGFYTLCKDQKFSTEIRIKDEFGYHINANSDYIQKGSCYGIKPSFTFTLPGKEIRPYTRVGATLAFLKMEESMNMNITTDNPVYYPYEGMENTLQYKMRMSAGVNISVGLEYMVANRLWLYGEVEGNIVKYIPLSAEYSEYIVNRQDITDKLTVHEREINFVDSYSDNDNKSADEPTKMLPVHYSFSSVGFSVGLKYTLFD
jgi:hypothetical protein